MVNLHNSVTSRQKKISNSYLNFIGLTLIILLQYSISLAQTNYCLTSIAAREKQTSVTITWEHDESASYTVYRSTTGPNEGFSVIATTTNDYSMYMDKSVVVSQMYYYRVESANNCFSPVINVMPRSRARNMPPFINSQPVTTATQSQAYTYQVEATDRNRNAQVYLSI